MQTYAIASQKGGVAKTTTTISLSAGLAHAGRRVLLVDLDSQANSSKVLVSNYGSLSAEDTVYRTIREKKLLAIHQTAVARLDIVPSHILLSSTDASLAAEIGRETRLTKQLARVAQDYDYVFIDCPPALGFLTINALAAADSVIIPTAPGFFELDSLNQIHETIQLVQEEFNPELSIEGILFCMSAATVESRNCLNVLRSVYGDLVFNTVIPRNVTIKEAHYHHQDVFSFDPSCRAAQEYGRLLKEVFHV